MPSITVQHTGEAAPINVTIIEIDDFDESDEWKEREEADRDYTTDCY